MKIRLAVSEESIEMVQKFLKEKGIEIDDDSPFILTERDHYTGYLAVRQIDSNEKIRLAVDDIIYIESFGHIIEVHGIGGVYQTSDRIYQLASMLDPTEFLRISNSVIISKKKVKQIKPSLHRKFGLVMQNGSQLDVTRSYYSSFRDAFHI